MNPTLRTASALGLLAAALAASAQQTVYDTTGYAPGVSTGIDRSPASLFSPSASGLLSGLQVRMFNGTATPAPFNVRLFADVPPTSTSGAGSTDTIGAQLGAFSGSVPTTKGTVVFVPATGVSLLAGTKYWLQVDGGLNGGTGSDVAFSQTSGAPTTTIHLNNLGYSANQQPFAFAVQVVPEPSALAALGLGAVALLKRRKRA